MPSCRVSLARGVNFEVPREYAAYCKGHPVRVTPSAAPEAGVLLTWNPESLCLASVLSRVEYDMSSIKGLVVNTSETISGSVACTLRVVFAANGDQWSTLPVFSASPAHRAGFEQLVADVRACGLPVPCVSSVKELRSRV